MPSIHIRPLTLDDLLPLQNISKQTFYEAFASLNSEENMATYLAEGFALEKVKAELNNPNSQFYFAMQGDVIIGYLKVNVGASQTELQDAQAMEIERIYVLEKFYGQKVGQVLFEKAMQIAKDLQVNYVWLGVWEENHRAIAFYQKNGFVSFDKHIFMLGDDAQTDIMMRLEMPKIALPKTPLLLLHGALGTSQSFQRVIPLLSDKFDIYTFDFIAHGKNSNDDNILNINNLTNQIIAFLDENQLEKVPIFGYSMGGYAAMNLAYLKPERVASLFTFATKWDWNETSASKEAAMLNPAKIEEKVPKFAAYLAALHGENHWKNTTQKVQEMMLDLGKTNLFSAAIFNQINVPILLGVGDRDTTVSIEETINVYRHLPNARLLVAPNTPHAFEKIDVKTLTNNIRYF